MCIDIFRNVTMEAQLEEVLRASEALTKYHKALVDAHLTDTASILKITEAEFQLATGLGKTEADEALKIVCELTLGSETSNIFTPLSRIVEQRQSLSFGCPILDEHLDGGLPVRGITELSGESASGKSQLCLQLSLVTLLGSPVETHVVYICTEDRFPDLRLRQMQNALGHAGRSLSDNLLVSQVGELDMLMSCLENTLPLLRSSKHVSLLVLDSVAALFRSEYTKDQAIQRSAALVKLGNILDRTWRSGVAVLCVNQVTDLMPDSVPVVSPPDGASCQPSLGLTWANFVTTRLFTSKTSLIYQESSRAPSTEPEVRVRRLQVVFSPYLPNKPEGCLYVVVQQGVRGIRDTDPLIARRPTIV